nr:ribonuclease H-like domain-containing protein [Tanacetum cinerariifolium]
MSDTDKFRLGYGDYRYGSILSYENEVLQSVFMNKECDLENTPVNDRCAEGMHATSADESDSRPVEFASSDSDSIVETTTSMLALVEDAPKVVSEPKVWTDAPIIEEYESDSDDDSVENVKETCTPNHCLKVEKQDRHSHTRKDLSYARKSCFICGSFSHLIRDCDFHEKRMAKQAALTKSKEKVTGQQAHRPVWNNVKRVNHQNKFVPSVLLTKTGKIPDNAARQNFSRQAALTSTASKVNTARPFVNETRPKRYFYKSHSSIKSPFHNKTAQRNTFANYKVKTVNTSLSVVKGNWDSAVKASAGCNWKNKRNTCNTDDPHKALKDKGIIDSGCSRHMTGNKAYLADYQEFKGGSVAFGGSNGKITGKGKIKAGRLDFKDVYYMDEVKHYNLFSVSQICDKKNKVLFIDTDCLVLSLDFKLPDENQVILKIPRQHNMYSFNLKNIDPYGDVSCLFAKASIDESNKWHRRPGHVKFKNLNKLVKGNLVRGKFNGKSDLGFLVGYSLNSKAFRVYNLETKRVEENQHVNFLENKPNVAGTGHAWMFDLDYLINFMNYEPVSLENQANKSVGSQEANNSVGTQATNDQGANSVEIDLHDEHFLLPICAPVNVVGPSRALNDDEPSYPDDPSMPHLKDIYVSPSATRSKVHKNSEAYAFVSYIQKQQRNNHKDFQHSLFVCFYLKLNPKRSLKHWKMKVRLMLCKRNCCSLKFRRGVVVRNKARLVTQGHRQEEGIDYDEVFTHVARIEAIRIFLAFASYMGFIVYQMDVKSAFLYGTIDEEVYVTQTPGFVDSKFPNKRKVDIEEELLTRLCLSSKKKRMSLEMDTHEKDKNKAKNDKTEHKMEKIEKDKVIRSRKVKSQSPRSTRSTPRMSKLTPTKPKQKNKENTTYGAKYVKPLNLY